METKLRADVSLVSFVLDLVKAAVDSVCSHRFLTFGSAGTNKTPNPAFGLRRLAQICFSSTSTKCSDTLTSVLVEYFIRMDSCTRTTEHLKITVCGRFNLKRVLELKCTCVVLKRDRIKSFSTKTEHFELFINDLID